MFSVAASLGALAERITNIDSRSLAAFRISFGVLLLLDLAVRLPVVSLHYSNTGLVTDHFARFVDPSSDAVSLLFGLNTPAQVYGFFAACAAIDVAFTVGYRTRTMQLLALLGTVSVHQRNPLTLYGSDQVIHVLLAWTWFLPLGERGSIDALRGEASIPSTALARAGVVLQLSAIYVLNAINKDGPTWTGGEAIYDVLWQDSIARPLGVWMRTGLPPAGLAALTHCTRIVELVGGLLLLSPWRIGACRAVALGALATLHLGIFACVNVGLFSITMLCAFPVMIPGSWWDAVGRRRGWTWSAARPAPAPPDSAWGRAFRELGAAYCLAASIASFLAYEPRVPERLRIDMPRWARPWTTVTAGPHLWGMFGPDAPIEDGWFVVEARTADGRMFDPISGGRPLGDLPPGFGAWLPQERIAYSIRMRHGAWRVYQTDLERYLWRYDLQPGRSSADRIVAYRAYDLTRIRPPPGRPPGPATKILLVEASRPEGD